MSFVSGKSLIWWGCGLVLGLMGFERLLSSTEMWPGLLFFFAGLFALPPSWLAFKKLSKNSWETGARVTVIIVCVLFAGFGSIVGSQQDFGGSHFDTTARPATVSNTSTKGEVANKRKASEKEIVTVQKQSIGCMEKTTLLDLSKVAIQGSESDFEIVLAQLTAVDHCRIFQIGEKVQILEKSANTGPVKVFFQEDKKSYWSGPGILEKGEEIEEASSKDSIVELLEKGYASLSKKNEGRFSAEVEKKSANSYVVTVRLGQMDSQVMSALSDYERRGNALLAYCPHKYADVWQKLLSGQKIMIHVISSSSVELFSGQCLPPNF